MKNQLISLCCTVLFMLEVSCTSSHNGKSSSDNTLFNKDGKYKYSTYHRQRSSHFETLPINSEDIIFLGNSLTDGCEWSELFDNPHVKNRGISGDVTVGVYDRLDAITCGHPAKIFLMIGINDLAQGVHIDTVVHNIEMIVRKIKKDSPETRLYVQSLLPVSDHYDRFSGHSAKGFLIQDINEDLEAMAKREKVTYIDLYSYFVDPDTEKMRLDLTNDGLHLLGAGYLLWRDILKKYI